MFALLSSPRRDAAQRSIVVADIEEMGRAL
jgi:hypothetical protein